MLKHEYKRILPTLAIGLCLTLSALGAPPATAQSGGYQTTEDRQADNGLPPDDNVAPPGDNAGAVDNASAGPVRLARFGYVRGNVTWRGDESGEWSQATSNLPIRQGAQVWATEGGRAEIQFDDGSVLRLGSNALVTLRVLYSDADGEFTQLTVNDGLVTLYARHDHSVYQVDTPLVSVKTTGPSRVRFGVGGGVEVAVQRGRATIDGQQGKVDMNAGDYVDLADEGSPYEPRRVPGEDSWDQWNDGRDRILEGDTPTDRNCPPNVALVAGDLDSYGTWHEDPAYGHVWCPQVRSADWRPYSTGHWTWVAPFGWTWVADEAWGWAPYHYGSWVYEPYGWAWVPGPVTQYWCPAVVSFTYVNGSVCWAPLAPRECRYPASLSIGFGGGNWAAFFSIGQAGCYYPAGETYCVARPYNNVYVNHVTYVNNFTSVTNVYNNYSANYVRTQTANKFVPVNAARYPGASRTTLAGFTGGGAYQPMARSEATAFSRGQTFAPPPAGRMPLAGPPAAVPTARAVAPNRTLTHEVQPPSEAISRPIYHAPLPNNVRQSLPASARTPGAGTGISTRPGGAYQGARYGNSSAPGTSGSRNSAPAGGYDPAAAAQRARAALGYPMSGVGNSGTGNRNSTSGNVPGATGGQSSGTDRYPGRTNTGSGYTPRQSPTGGSGYTPRQSQPPAGGSRYGGGGYHVNQETPRRGPTTGGGDRGGAPKAAPGGGSQGGNSDKGKNGNGHP